MLKKLLLRTGLAGGGFAILIIGSLAILSLFEPMPAGDRIIDGRLLPCPDSPNCVCSEFSDAASSRADHFMDPISFTGPAEEALRKLRSIIEAEPRSRIVAEEDAYLRVEFKSLIFRYTDDVEFRIDGAENVIHFRSASRVGHSDLGVNRRRMQRLAAQFQKAG